MKVKGKLALVLMILAGGLIGAAGCANFAANAAADLDRIGSSFDPTDADPEKMVFIPVSFIPQPNDMLCGPASLASVMGYYGYTRVDEYLDEWARREKRLVKFKELARDARDRGFDVSLAQLSERRLRQLLNQGRPVIVLLTQPFGVDHMVVVIGYSHIDDSWILSDPGFGLRTMPASRFSSRWADRLCASMLVVPGDQFRGFAGSGLTGRSDQGANPSRPNQPERPLLNFE